jgi:4-hydroxybenzoate polyprenyltransferase
MLFFFSLALLKRYSELALVGLLEGATEHTHGYRTGDAPMVAAVGRAAGFVAMVVLALYPFAEPGSHPGPAPIALICVLLLYWMHRLWRLASEGRIHDDPVLFTFRDRQSVILGIAVLLIILAAT